ncbi:ABC transporter permease [Xanthobacter pseudotagetidis]|uniref:ABC transporter permease n=1 Tax=Xanthobacter pseudotagetidis TaxID=3119911 RepID=UPI00372C429C
MAEKPALSPSVVLICVVVYALFILPMFVTVAASFTQTQTVQFPPRGFTLHWYGEILNDRELMDGMALSAVIALCAAVAASVLGTLGALYLARADGVRRELFQSLALAPLTIPHVLIGLAFLMTFSSLGLINAYGLALAHVVICLPYVTRSVLSILMAGDASLPRAAAVLGASPIRTLIHVTLPSVRPGIISGAVFAYLVSFNNVSISMFVSSPRTATLPVVIFNRIDYVPNPSIVAVAALMILATSLVLLALDKAFALFRTMFG